MTVLITVYLCIGLVVLTIDSASRPANRNTADPGLIGIGESAGALTLLLCAAFWPVTILRKAFKR